MDAGSCVCAGSERRQRSCGGSWRPTARPSPGRCGTSTPRRRRSRRGGTRCGSPSPPALWVLAPPSLEPHWGSASSCSQPARDAPRAELLFSLLLTGRTEGAEGPAGAGEAGLGGQLREEGGNGKSCPPEVPPTGSERDLKPRLLSPLPGSLAALSGAGAAGGDEEGEGQGDRAGDPAPGGRHVLGQGGVREGSGEQVRGKGRREVPGPAGAGPFSLSPEHLSSELWSSVSAGRSSSQGQGLPLT